MVIDMKELRERDKYYRINVLNSITGIKPANLIGTRSQGGVSNLTIFSSVVHLGSTPPLIGMISRPSGEIRRHTLENIMSQGLFSINHLLVTMTEQGHYTSAKFGDGESEFDACGFTEEYLDGYEVPLVKESPVKILLQHKENIPIKANGTIMIIGEVLKIVVSEEWISKEGQIDLAAAGSAGISGLDSYYELRHKATYPYARVKDLPDFTS